LNAVSFQEEEANVVHSLAVANDKAASPDVAEALEDEV
jgi:hypothetical protein